MRPLHVRRPIDGTRHKIEHYRVERALFSLRNERGARNSVARRSSDCPDAHNGGRVQTRRSSILGALSGHISTTPPISSVWMGAILAMGFGLSRLADGLSWYEKKFVRPAPPPRDTHTFSEPSPTDPSSTYTLGSLRRAGATSIGFSESTV